MIRSPSLSGSRYGPQSVTPAVAPNTLRDPPRLYVTKAFVAACASRKVVDRAVADPGVKRFLDGKPIRKVVYVPDRLLNLVV